MGGIPRLNLFGIPELRDPTGAVIKLRTKKQLGLLVYLTLEARARPVPRDTVIDLLWPDADSAHGRHSLAQALTAIRNALGPDCLSRGRDTVRVASRIETDLDCVTEIFTETDLERPLARLDTWAGAEFAHWVDGARQQCKEIVRERLQALIHELREHGSTDRMIECGKALLSVDPLSHLGIRALAEEALLSGDISRGITIVREYVQSLRENLGIPASADITRLLKSLEAGSYPASHQTLDQLDRHLPNARRSMFVGREEDLAWLEAQWRLTCSGQRARCLVAGPGGVGKSSLVHRFATSLTARSHAVFVVSCHEIGHRIPFAFTADLLSTLAKDPRLSETDPMWLAEASRIFPTLKSIYPGIPEPSLAPPETIRVRLADALNHMLKTMREDGPIALVFDDIHHLDQTSRDILFLLEQRMADEPIALFATIRSETAGRISSRLEPFRWTASRQLGPLTDQQSTDLVKKLCATVPTKEAFRIVELSDGNPHFIEMLVRDWEDHHATSLVTDGRSAEERVTGWEPPPTFQSAFTRMYEGLGDISRKILQFLAVAGRAFALEEVAAVLSASGNRIAEPVVELFDRGIIRFDASSITFKNELHRAFVYHSMRDDVRKYRHRQIADALQHDLGTVRRPDALETGYHLLRGGRSDWASQVLIAGAEQAMSFGAPSEAERALLAMTTGAGHTVPTAHRIALARAQFAQGKHAAALRTLEPLHSDDRPTNVVQLAQCEILRAQASIASGLLSDAKLEEAATSALSAAVGSQREDLLVESLQVAGEIAGELGDLDRLSELMARSRHVIESIAGGPSRGVALSAIGYSYLITGDARAALVAFDEGFAALGSDTKLPATLRTLNGAGIACVSLADRSRATARFTRALEHARHLGDAGAEAVLNRNLGALKMEFGDFVEAAEHFDQALALYTQQPTARYGCTIYGAAAAFSMTIGALDQADQLITEGETCARTSPVTRDVIDLVLLRADLHLASGEMERAWELLEQGVLPAGRKTYVLGEAARYERLLRYYTLATQGLDQYLSLRAKTELRIQRLPASGRLEVQGFDEWVDRTLRDRPAGAVISDALGMGLVGVLVHLASLGTSPLDITHGHERTAITVLRLVRPDWNPQVPFRLGWTDSRTATS